FLAPPEMILRRAISGKRPLRRLRSARTRLGRTSFSVLIPVRALLAVGVLLILSGCGVYGAYGGCSTLYRSHFLAATTFDVDTIGKSFKSGLHPSEEGSHGCCADGYLVALLIVDLPFSFVADVVVIPIVRLAVLSGDAFDRSPPPDFPKTDEERDTD